MRGRLEDARDVEEVRLRNLIYLCSDWLDPSSPGCRTVDIFDTAFAAQWSLMIQSVAIEHLFDPFSLPLALGMACLQFSSPVYKGP